MNWKDYYTSYALSKKIQELKGELHEDDPYWESPLTFIWLEKPNDDGEPYTLSSYTFLKKTWPQILQNHKFLPAYHILQDICCEYKDLFFVPSLDQLIINPVEEPGIYYDSYHIFTNYQNNHDKIKMEEFILDNLKEGRFKDE